MSVDILNMSYFIFLVVQVLRRMVFEIKVLAQLPAYCCGIFYIIFYHYLISFAKVILNECGINIDLILMEVLCFIFII